MPAHGCPEGEKAQVSVLSPFQKKPENHNAPKFKMSIMSLMLKLVTGKPTASPPTPSPPSRLSVDQGLASEKSGEEGHGTCLSASPWPPGRPPVAPGTLPSWFPSCWERSLERRVAAS